MLDLTVELRTTALILQLKDLKPALMLFNFLVPWFDCFLLFLVQQAVNQGDVCTLGFSFVKDHDGKHPTKPIPFWTKV